MKYIVFSSGGMDYLVEQVVCNGVDELVFEL